MDLSRRDMVLTSLLAFAAPAAVAQGRKRLHLQGANFFDGSRFERRDIWVVDGRFSCSKPSGGSTVPVDVSGQWLVPPFADAHSHSFGEGQPLRERERAAAYVRDGVFLVMSQGNLPLDRDEQSGLGINTADGPEVLFANGSVVPPGELVRGFFEAIVFPSGAFPERDFSALADRRYFEVADETALAAKWPLIRRSRPDFIKIYLHNSERDQSVGFAPFFKGYGLDPSLVPRIVSRAHAEGLRVSAHVATNGDIKVALDGGVDMLAHVPDGPITSDVAQRVAQAKVPVATTMAFRAQAMPPPARAVLEKNLRLLHAAGANLVLGADVPGDTGTGEASYLAATGLWTNAELLSMWCRQTPQAIRPDRPTGFVEGADASFLMLSGNPIHEWGAVRNISRRMKKGMWLS